jgi:hypothetical protein
MQIHVDRYKHNVYSHLTDPFLRSLITLDGSKTRFHACERFNRCPYASGDDVVYINPITMSKSKWDQYLALTDSKLRAAQPVTVLVRPLLPRFRSSPRLHVSPRDAAGAICAPLASSRTPRVRFSIPPSACRAQQPKSVAPWP